MGTGRSGVDAGGDVATNAQARIRTPALSWVGCLVSPTCIWQRPVPPTTCRAPLPTGQTLRGWGAPLLASALASLHLPLQAELRPPRDWESQLLLTGHMQGSLGRRPVALWASLWGCRERNVGASLPHSLRPRKGVCVRGRACPAEGGVEGAPGCCGVRRRGDPQAEAWVPGPAGSAPLGEGPGEPRDGSSRGRTCP